MDFTPRMPPYAFTRVSPNHSQVSDLVDGARPEDLIAMFGLNLLDLLHLLRNQRLQAVLETLQHRE
jgi:hypothetical protein